VTDQAAENIPSDPRDSAELLAAGAERDPSALTTLLIRHLPDLRAFVRLRIDAVLRQHESESDLLQSVCADVLAHPERFEFRDEAAFRNWLYGAVLNRIAAHRDRYLAQRRNPDRVDRARPIEELTATYSTLFDPVQQASHRELVDRLEQAFDQLSAEQREVLTLHRIVGLTHVDIATRLGRSEVATRQMLHRAMAKLAVLLRERPGQD